MFKKLIVLYILSLFTVSCVKENLTDCNGFRFLFSYSFNMQGVNLVEEDVHAMRIYLFDAQDILVDIVSVNEQDLKNEYKEVNLDAGRYTAVAWACSGGDITQGGYEPAESADLENHLFKEIAIGSTTKSQFYMTLKSKLLPDDVLGDVEPAAEKFEDLFYSMVENIHVVKGKSQKVNLDFIKNSNTLKIKVTGLQHLTSRAFTSFVQTTEQPLLVYAIAKNGRYMFNNTIDEYARSLRYEPPYSRMDANSMDVDIKMLYLSIERHTDITTPLSDPVLLYVQRPGTGHNMIEPLDVVKAILEVKKPDGTFQYKTQEDIDRTGEFSIELSILHDLSVKVSINGFEIENLDPDIGRP